MIDPISFDIDGRPRLNVDPSKPLAMERLWITFCWPSDPKSRCEALITLAALAPDHLNNDAAKLREIEALARERPHSAELEDALAETFASNAAAKKAWEPVFLSAGGVATLAAADGTEKVKAEIARAKRPVLLVGTLVCVVA